MKRFAEYLAVFAVAALAFAITSVVWSGLTSALIAAATSAGIAVAIWWWFVIRRRDAAADLGVPSLGSIPDHGDTGPAPALSIGSVDGGYGPIADAVAQLPDVQVLLVTSPAPGQGATTVALNLAIASSRAGRRVLLVDADRIASTLSRFNGTGTTPGLYDIAAGTAGLEDAARMWNLGGDTRLPMIPIGSDAGEVADLASPHLAGVVDRVGERADLIIIDAPSATFDGIPRELAAHADGTLLVVPPTGSRDAATRARDTLDEIGAPVVGYVVNRGRPASGPTGWRLFRRFTATAVLLMVAYTAWTGVSIWTKWLGVERAEVDTRAARVDLAATAPDTDAAPDGSIDIDQLAPAIADSVDPSGPVDTASFETFLILGSDSDTPDVVTGRADVIILVLLPTDGSSPGMVSLPRDLFLPNACTNGYTRINAGLRGCGSTATGLELMSINVEDFTGIEVDHVALFDFEGFENIIDAVGGIEICVSNPVRSGKTSLGLSLPAGCGVYDGETTLKWVRSRQTQELVDGTWRSMQGVNDLTRNTRQQDVIIQMFSKMQQMRNPAQLAAVVGELSEAFTLDESIGIGEAVSLAWSMRELGAGDFTRFAIPVTGHITTTGANVLLPTEPFDALVAQHFPGFQTTAATQ
ncbi:MAG: hypothetical protein HKN01_03990 [Acidimicrobiia bacterium]|nr:hypothetical protein [Acidimicrobiia bacterium]